MKNRIYPKPQKINDPPKSWWLHHERLMKRLFPLIDSVNDLMYDLEK
jgi:hypothetical protein